MKNQVSKFDQFNSNELKKEQQEKVKGGGLTFGELRNGNGGS